ncbi:hypothetical protein [Rhizobium sp. CECT 9324]|uniref:hypothetical protein n=1 Tax=Rhizobium sp. CECT 9324 TaxID=2845820 RepID=UPI001E431ABC|nr:hypothetical protein [Rhizobium sp. CECT 9324]CAH0338925.1 hypothetical protein RHI9324_00560 [Rhizobium sp. CECT 9324]
MSRRRSISWGTIALTASGWIVSVFLGLLELPAKINSFTSEAPKAKESVADWLLLDQDYTGMWTSSLEGWVDATDQELNSSTDSGGPVSLRMRVYNGRVEGEIESTGLSEIYVYSAILIEGEKRDNGIDLLAYDYVGGKKTNLALMRLTLNDEDERLPLHLETIKQGGPFFPERARLYRASADVSEAIKGSLNMELMRQVIEKGRAEARPEKRE